MIKTRKMKFKSIQNEERLIAITIMKMITAVLIMAIIIEIITIITVFNRRKIQSW